MERLADEVVDDVRTVVLRGVDVVDAELDRAAQHGATGVRVARRAEDSGAGELHRTEADAVDALVTEERGTREAGHAPHHSRRASSRFRTLPVGLRGNSSRKTTSRGTLYRARFSLTNALTPSSSIVWPSRVTMNARRRLP